MRLTISNDVIVTLDNAQEVKGFVSVIDPLLKARNPTYESLLRVDPSRAIRMPRFLFLYHKDGLSVHIPFGSLKKLWGNAIPVGTPYELRFHKMIGNMLDDPKVELYHYQKRAVKTCMEKKNGILIAPCGSGKTTMGLVLIGKLKGKALWLTNNHKLLKQAEDRAREMWPDGDFGEITEGKVSIGTDITFATVQTMARIEPNSYKDLFDVLVVDECHHCVGSPTRAMQFYRVVNSMACRYKFGLTATLKRSDDLVKTAISLLGDVAYEVRESDLGDKTMKAIHYRVDYDGSEYPLEAYCGTDGMLNYSKLISLLSSDWNRNRFIADKIVAEKTRMKRKRQIVLCHRIEQVKQICKLLQGRISVSAVYGQKNRDYSGEVIVATYALAQEGLDIPELDTLHLATPQKSSSITIQCAGRIERRCEGKLLPIVYDYVDVKIPYCIGAYRQRKRALKERH